MNRQGKCGNYADCLLAYRNETITISEGPFVCPECKQPLTPLSAAAAATPKLIPTLIVGGIITLTLIAIVSVWLQARRLPKNTGTPEMQAQHALENQGNLIPERAKPAAEPSASPVVEEAAAGPVSAPAAPNLDPQSEENQKVKAEVLKRIDLMPNISADNKDKLYMSVERARKMGRVLIIPFAKGKTALSPADVDAIKAELGSPQLRELMQDPTCVFVILGFADTKGDEKTNLRVTQERAQNALSALRDKCGVINVMHAVAMGGSSLFDAQGVEKNRAVEIWAVLP
ncbi:MAG: hypothetical protein QOD99_20 [Chthoniobacter sp.]|nr:hypothetical protein [Chthoniobacter sp.]